jgi:hypothetical protein
MAELLTTLSSDPLELDFTNHARRRLLWVLAIITLALALFPAPLLPPHGIAEWIMAAAGSNWRPSYILAVVGIRTVFYGVLGVLAALGLGAAKTIRGRILQILLVPLAIITLGLLIRSLKVGHLPVWAQLVVPAVSCALGTWIGLAARYRRVQVTLAVVTALLGLTLWSLLGGVPSKVSSASAEHLRHLIAEASPLSGGDKRFATLVESAFAKAHHDSGGGDAVLQNRAAILALGIALGHEKIARLAGLGSDADLVRQASAARGNATLRGREDWPRHYLASAAFAVLENPFFSDSAGLVKEALDTLNGGSGFSFTDLAADKAGILFAEAATRNEASARAMQERLQKGFDVEAFFPPVSDLPDGLSADQFRSQYGGVGGRGYRSMLQEIDRRLSRCSGLL